MSMALSKTWCMTCRCRVDFERYGYGGLLGGVDFADLCGRSISNWECCFILVRKCKVE